MGITLMSSQNQYGNSTQFGVITWNKKLSKSKREAYDVTHTAGALAKPFCGYRVKSAVWMLPGSSIRKIIKQLVTSLAEDWGLNPRLGFSP